MLKFLRIKNYDLFKNWKLEIENSDGQPNAYLL